LTIAQFRAESGLRYRSTRTIYVFAARFAGGFFLLFISCWIHELDILWMKLRSWVSVWHFYFCYPHNGGGSTVPIIKIIIKVAFPRSVQWLWNSEARGTWKR